jgi:exopolysaccharide biosynthesis predicted pyruvyltransferase EpsI
MMENKSPFHLFIETLSGKKIYFDKWIAGNNGDTLIRMGAEHVLRKARCKLVDSPQYADQIVIRGSGSIVDVYESPFEKLIYYRKNYGHLPLIVGPSTYRFNPVDFKKMCEIASSPLIFFARDKISAGIVLNIGLPKHCDVRISQDLAFELQDSDLIADLRRNCAEKHILIAMRKDKEGLAKVLTRTTGTWLPKSVRRPLSWIRDRLVAHISKDTVETILKQERISVGLPRIYRDVATSLNFEEFAASIRDAALIVTNRLHIAVLGHLLNKRVVIVCATDYHKHKLKGVYELSMSGPNSRTSLHMIKEDESK